MRFFRKITHVCQNCVKSNNEKGKWKKTIFIKDAEGTKRKWNIFCEKKQKYFPWDRYKYCFKKGQLG